MAPFAGFEMPIQYSGILDEHRAVREAAGLFDVSHMGEFRLRGPDALALAQRLVTNDVSKLDDGKALYAVLCHASGGAVDDLLVYRLAHDDVMLVVNAANVGKDWAHVTAVADDAGLDVDLADESNDTALLALQGPRAFEIFEAATGLDVSDIGYYRFVRPAPGAVFGAERAVVSQTGYTGEKGLEIYLEPGAAGRAWDALLEAGAERGLVPAGLGRPRHAPPGGRVQPLRPRADGRHHPARSEPRVDRQARRRRLRGPRRARQAKGGRRRAPDRRARGRGPGPPPRGLPDHGPCRGGDRGRDQREPVARAGDRDRARVRPPTTRSTRRPARGSASPSGAACSRPS